MNKYKYYQNQRTIVNKFEQELLDLEKKYYLNLLPPSNDSDTCKIVRKTMVSIILEYTPCNKEICVIFHAGSMLIKNEAFFVMKQDGYRRLSECFANIMHRHITNSKLYENIVKLEMKQNVVQKLIDFFENDKNWQIEWITKWSVKNVFNNHYDLLLNIESLGFDDSDISVFIEDFERALKRYYN